MPRVLPIIVVVNWRLNLAILIDNLFALTIDNVATRVNRLKPNANGPIAKEAQDKGKRQCTCHRIQTNVENRPKAEEGHFHATHTQTAQVSLIFYFLNQEPGADFWYA